jgi:16S rRNA pseudouridine516 synthase
MNNGGTERGPAGRPAKRAYLITRIRQHKNLTRSRAAAGARRGSRTMRVATAVARHVARAGMPSPPAARGLASGALPAPLPPAAAPGRGPPPSTPDSLLLAELLRRPPPIRLEALLSHHLLSSRRGARAFLRSARVTAVPDLPRTGRRAGVEAGGAGGAGAGAPVRIMSGSVRVVPYTLAVDGVPVPYAGVPLHVAVHKPPGVVCSHAEGEGDTLYGLLPAEWGARRPPPQAVGRLDRMASGLVIVTQSGALNARLSAPDRHARKAYVVSTAEPLSPGAAAEAAVFAAGNLALADGGIAAPAVLRPHRTDPRLCEVTLTEGRHHQLRRMFAAVGHAVTGIHRTAIGSLRLADLKLAPGEWTLLAPEHLAALLEVPLPPRAGAAAGAGAGAPAAVPADDGSGGDGDASNGDESETDGDEDGVEVQPGPAEDPPAGETRGGRAGA